MITAPLEIGVIVKDINKLCEFYVRTFNLDEINNIHVSNPPEFALSASPYQVVRLQFPYGERIKLLTAKNTKPTKFKITNDFTSQQNLIFITIIVEKLEPVQELITLHGGALLETPVELRKGMRVAFATDPEGNPIELTEYDPVSAYRTDLQARA